MAYDYDKLYGTTPSALGKPTQIFVDFFERQSETNFRVLDIGCGQGRDALFIARMGHSVVGIDLSANGIRDLVNTANKESLDIKGIVADIITFIPDGNFDVILIDRTLHMLTVGDRLVVLERLLSHVSNNGWVLISDERSNIAEFKDILTASANSWDIELEKGGKLFLRRS